MAVIRLARLFTRLGGVLLGLSLLAGCSLCEETQRSQTVSSRGDRATVLVRDCGATTDFATLVAGRSFFKTDVVAVTGRQDLGVKWSPDGATLTIVIPESARNEKEFWKTDRVGRAKVVIVRR